mgnify:CR=1 FL=1|tara:strand:+ start:57 stop:731 length:675 start_codon:yes stop_codon:yes gene_type:complete
MGLFDFFKKKKSIEEITDELLERNPLFLDGKKIPFKARKSLQRVDWNETEDIGIITHYNGAPFSGICFSKHSNGKIEEDIEMVEGLKQGIGMEYNDEGKLTSITCYVKDLPLFRNVFNKDGSSVIISFVNGKVTEESIFDNKDNLLLTQYRELKKGKYEGYMEGPMILGTKHFYRDGKLIDMKAFDSNGNEIAKVVGEKELKSNMKKMMGGRKNIFFTDLYNGF